MSSDLSFLPSEIVARSLSPREIVLRLDDALAALEHLRAAERRIDSWEGWVQLPGGGRTRSLEHQGAFVLPPDTDAAARRAAEQMREAQQKWDRRPEYEGGMLYFCVITSG